MSHRNRMFVRALSLGMAVSMAFAAPSCRVYAEGSLWEDAELELIGWEDAEEPGIYYDELELELAEEQAQAGAASAAEGQGAASQTKDNVIEWPETEAEIDELEQEESVNQIIEYVEQESSEEEKAEEKAQAEEETAAAEKEVKEETSEAAEEAKEETAAAEEETKEETSEEKAAEETAAAEEEAEEETSEAAREENAGAADEAAEDGEEFPEEEEVNLPASVVFSGEVEFEDPEEEIAGLAGAAERIDAAGLQKTVKAETEADEVPEEEAGVEEEEPAAPEDEAAGEEPAAAEGEADEAEFPEEVEAELPGYAGISSEELIFEDPEEEGTTDLAGVSTVLETPADEKNGEAGQEEKDQEIELEEEEPEETEGTQTAGVADVIASADEENEAEPEAADPETEELVFEDPDSEDAEISYVTAGVEQALTVEEEAEAEQEAPADDAAAAEEEEEIVFEEAEEADGSDGKGNTVVSSVVSGTREKIVNYALSYVGAVPYVYGGSSLESGVDCSGFVQQIFKKVGINLPHSSDQQGTKGTGVSSSNMEPGDIVYYGGHVAIYIGDGKVVHASNEKTGVKVSDWNYRGVAGIRNVID